MCVCLIEIKLDLMWYDEMLNKYFKLYFYKMLGYFF